MSQVARVSRTVLDPYRSGDWEECIRVVRPVVEDDPDDLPVRLLLGQLYLKTSSRELALLQFERLFPLAIGQGDLFMALAAQRRLDEMRPEATTDARHHAAMHQWFSSLPTRRRKKKPPQPGSRLTPARLMELTRGRFADVAEQAQIEVLNLEPREEGVGEGLLWVVLYGRIRWSLEHAGEGGWVEAVACEGDTIFCPPDLRGGSRVRLAPELPAECLKLDPSLLEGVGSGGIGGAVAVPSPTAPAAAPTPRVESRVPAKPAKGASPPAAAPSIPRPKPPAPDPVAEPTLAVGAPLDRRRETRVNVRLKTRVALLGLAGTRVAPLDGLVRCLSPSGIGLRFRSAEALHARRALENAVVSVHLALTDRLVLKLAARVRWIGTDRGARRDGDPHDVRLGLEFVLLTAEDRARIELHVDHELKAGDPLAAG